MSDGDSDKAKTKVRVKLNPETVLFNETGKYLEIIRATLALAEKTTSSQRRKEIIELVDKMISNYDSLSQAAKEMVGERAANG